MLKRQDRWYVVPDKQNVPAVWIMLNDKTKTANMAMVEWHAKQRKIAALLYPVLNNSNGNERK